MLICPAITRHRSDSVPPPSHGRHSISNILSEAMRIDLSHLKATAEQIGTHVSTLADALRSSPDQAAIDEIASKLDAVDAALKGLVPDSSAAPVDGSAA